MAATFIPALIIKQDHEVYLTSDLTVGVAGEIPTPGAGGYPDGDYWAVPVNDYGVVTGFEFIPTTPIDTDAPTPDSFHVFRLISKKDSTVWYVRGTTTTNTGESPAEAGYIQAAADAECCSEDPSALPTDVPTPQPCQLMCQYDANSKYFAIFGLPTQVSGWNIYPSGYFNGSALTAGNAVGYTSPSTLLTFLNANWTTVGTWTLINGNTGLQVTQTAGPGDDTICASFVLINQSA